MLVLRGGENLSNRRKTSRSRVENQQIQSTYGIEAENKSLRRVRNVRYLSTAIDPRRAHFFIIL